jgi:hypothetical protein
MTTKIELGLGGGGGSAAFMDLDELLATRVARLGQ